MAMKMVRSAHILGTREQSSSVVARPVRQAGLVAKFGEVRFPTDTVVELVKGQKRSTTRKFFPGLHVRANGFDQETFHLVKTRRASRDSWAG